MFAVYALIVYILGCFVTGFIIYYPTVKKQNQDFLENEDWFIKNPKKNIELYENEDSYIQIVLWPMFLVAYLTLGFPLLLMRILRTIVIKILNFIL